MNEYEISLVDFKIALKNRDYEKARKMLDGKYEEIFEACQGIAGVAQEMKVRGFGIKSSTDLEKACLNEKGLRLIVSLLELATNEGIMLTNAQLNNQEEK